MRENKRVSGNHLVLGIPSVQVLDGVRVDVPAVVVGVPVRIHGPE